MRKNTLFLVQLRTVYCYLYTNISITIENVLFSSGTNEASSSALLLCPSDILSTSFHGKHSLKSAIHYFTSSEAGDRYFFGQLTSQTAGTTKLHNSHKQFSPLFSSCKINLPLRRNRVCFQRPINM